MADNIKKQQTVAVISTLEEILSELDRQQLLLPALKIVEALEVLESSNHADSPPDC